MVFGGFKSYCMADSFITVAANGKDGQSQEVHLQVSKEASERVEGILICINAMPGVTKAVDKSLDLLLAELQHGLSPQTGVPAPGQSTLR